MGGVFSWSEERVLARMYYTSVQRFGRTQGDMEVLHTMAQQSVIAV